MIEPIDQLFLGFLMFIVGMFGFAVISDEVRKYPTIRWWWLGIWGLPPILKLWFYGIVAFFL